MDFPALRFFLPSEFRDWADKMDHAFLYALDNARLAVDSIGVKIKISDNPLSLGRKHGRRSSEHFYQGRPLKVADIFPYKIVGNSHQIRPLTVEEMMLMYYVMRDNNMTGIGVYPRWKWRGITFPGMHVDKRTSITGHVATWSSFPIRQDDGSVKSEYFPLKRAWAHYTEINDAY